MISYTVLVILCQATFFSFTEQSVFTNLVNCPCGNSGKNITFRVDNSNLNDVCSKWANCKNCQDGLDRCLECPEGFEGSTCSKERIKNVTSRQKRQSLPRFPNRSPDDLRARLERQTCGDPDFISNGVRISTDGSESTIRRTFQAGESVMFGCRSEEYALQGNTLLTCNNGAWSSVLPKCVKAVVISERPPCSDPGFITNGVRMTTDWIESTTRRTYQDGESVIYGCKSEEYALQGATFLTCNNGVWSRSLPKCVSTIVTIERPTCGDPGFISNGVRLTTGGSESTIRRTFQDGESVMFGCRSEEYGLQGATYLTCSNGAWSSALPRCDKTRVVSESLTCDDPGFIPNGVRVATDGSDSIRRRTFKDEEWVMFECISEEYDLQGATNLICNNGAWSSVLPKCVKTKVLKPTCDDPGFISKGIRRTTDGNEASLRRTFEDGESVMFECTSEEEYLSGETTIICNYGEWSRPLPRCDDKIFKRKSPKGFCPDPDQVSNANRFKLDGTLSLYEKLHRVGNSLKFSCHPEFSMQGHSIITCLGQGGRWNHPLPVCTPSPEIPTTTSTPGVLCQDPGQVSNADRLNVDGSLSFGAKQYNEGQSVKFSCHPGFSLQERSIITCLVRGRWSHPLPYCTPISSPAPAIIDTTDNSDVVYCLHPPSVPDGLVVDSSKPNSRAGDDGTLNEIEFPEGTRLQYSCQTRYTLKGADSLVCQKTGLWSDIPPTCSTTEGVLHENIIHCQHPGSLAEGEITFSPPETGPDVSQNDEVFPEKTILKYSCNDGFTVLGEPEVSCQTRGIWSAKKSNWITTCTDGTE